MGLSPVFVMACSCCLCFVLIFTLTGHVEGESQLLLKAAKTTGPCDNLTASSNFSGSSMTWLVTTTHINSWHFSTSLCGRHCWMFQILSITLNILHPSFLLPLTISKQYQVAPTTRPELLIRSFAAIMPFNTLPFEIKAIIISEYILHHLKDAIRTAATRHSVGDNACAAAENDLKSLSEALPNMQIHIAANLSILYAQKKEEEEKIRETFWRNTSTCCSEYERCTNNFCIAIRQVFITSHLQRRASRL